MTPETFEKLYPVVDSWIQSTLAAHAGKKRAVASCGFPCLPHYFRGETLASSKVVLVDRLPVPPLSRMGLPQFAEFERGNFNGITYLDTFFLKPAVAKDEAVHFHELIHVIQWRDLGAKEFLRMYADGLERFGYWMSPLEKVAYDAEAAFSSSVAFDAEKLVSDALTKMG
ncbi:MAG: hypothetical protein WBL48_17540 [Pseudolabrys sp.]